MNGPKHVYLDTNFLVKMHRQESTAFRDAWQSLQHRVMHDGWRCLTSDFARMEFVDVLQENEFILQELARKRYIDDILKDKRAPRRLTPRRRRALERKVESWLSSNSAVVTVATMNSIRVADLFALASVISINGPILAPDALHLAVALVLGCDMLLTNDESFREAVNQDLRRSTRLGRVTFAFLEQITGAPILRDEFDAQGRIIRALNVNEFLREYPPPSVTVALT